MGPRQSVSLSAANYWTSTHERNQAYITLTLSQRSTVCTCVKCPVVVFLPLTNPNFYKGILMGQGYGQTHLNVPVQLTKERVCICEDICSLKYTVVRKFTSYQCKFSCDLSEEGRVACHEGGHGVQDDMLLSLLHMKIFIVRVAMLSEHCSPPPHFQ